MLNPGGPLAGKQAERLAPWYDRLAPLVDDARKRLREIEPSRLIHNGGCTQDADGSLRLTFFWQDYLLCPPDGIRSDETSFVVIHADTRKQVSSFFQALILTYLSTAAVAPTVGTGSSGHWIGYRDLPNGLFYAQAFRGYAEIRLARELRGGIEAFRRCAERLHGEPLELGNAGYAFRVLPRIRLAALYWLGDEDFDSQASILFEDTASHYMTTDGLAILGSHLVGALLKAADETHFVTKPAS